MSSIKKTDFNHNKIIKIILIFKAKNPIKINNHFIIHIKKILDIKIIILIIIIHQIKIVIIIHKTMNFQI